jgi:hypothetical protein
LAADLAALVSGPEDQDWARYGEYGAATTPLAATAAALLDAQAAESHTLAAWKEYADMGAALAAENAAQVAGMLPRSPSPLRNSPTLDAREPRSAGRGASVAAMAGEIVQQWSGPGVLSPKDAQERLRPVSSLRRSPIQLAPATPSSAKRMDFSGEGGASAIGARGPGRPDKPDFVSVADLLREAAAGAQAAAQEARALERTFAFKEEEAEREGARARDAAIDAAVQADAAALAAAAEEAAAAREASVRAATDAARARLEGRSVRLVQAHVRGLIARRGVRLADMIAAARGEKVRMAAAAAAAEAARLAQEAAARAAEEAARAAREAVEQAAVRKRAAEVAEARARSDAAAAAELEAALEEQRRLRAELEERARVEAARRVEEEEERARAVALAAMEHVEKECEPVNVVWRVEAEAEAVRRSAVASMAAEDGRSSALHHVWAADARARSESRAAALASVRACLAREDALSALVSRVYNLEASFKGGRAHTALQAAWRGRVARRAADNPLVLARAAATEARAGGAATLLQAAWRGGRLRASLSAALEAARYSETDPLEAWGGEEEALLVGAMPSALWGPLKPGAAGAGAGALLPALERGVLLPAGILPRPLAAPAPAQPAPTPLHPSVSPIGTPSSTAPLLSGKWAPEEGNWMPVGRKGGAGQAGPSVRAPAPAAATLRSVPPGPAASAPAPSLASTGGLPVGGVGGSSFVGRVRAAVGAGRTGRHRGGGQALYSASTWGGAPPAASSGETARLHSVQDNLPDHLQPGGGGAAGRMPAAWAHAPSSAASGTA